MDGQRIAALARALAAGTTRRRLLRGLVAGIGALVVPRRLGASPGPPAGRSGALPPDRQVPPTAACPYGPNQCLPGYVWRVSRPDDLVCVTPDVRDQAADDNAHAAERKDPACATATCP